MRYFCCMYEQTRVLYLLQQSNPCDAFLLPNGVLLTNMRNLTRVSDRDMIQEARLARFSDSAVANKREIFAK